MTANKEQIYAKAEELSELIKDNEIYAKYKQAYDNLQANEEARDIHSRLIALGKELSEIGAKGEAVQAKHSAENALLQEQLEKNSIVKDFLTSQKVYLNLIKLIQEQIFSSSS